jgi:hypothetical protein
MTKRLQEALARAFQIAEAEHRRTLATRRGPDAKLIADSKYTAAIRGAIQAVKQ